MSEKKAFTPDERDRDISVLETYDIVSGERKVLHEFDHLIEAPNWTRTGRTSAQLPGFSADRGRST